MQTGFIFSSRPLTPRGPGGTAPFPRPLGPKCLFSPCPGRRSWGDATHPALDRGCAQEDADSHGQQAKVSVPQAQVGSGGWRGTWGCLGLASRVPEGKQEAGGTVRQGSKQR